LTPTPSDRECCRENRRGKKGKKPRSICYNFFFEKNEGAASLVPCSHNKKGPSVLVLWPKERRVGKEKGECPVSSIYSFGRKKIKKRHEIGASLYYGSPWREKGQSPHIPRSLFLSRRKREKSSSLTVKERERGKKKKALDYPTGGRRA